jgi:hypothetical protein
MPHGTFRVSVPGNTLQHENIDPNTYDNLAYYESRFDLTAGDHKTPRSAAPIGAQPENVCR